MASWGTAYAGVQALRFVAALGVVVAHGAGYVQRGSQTTVLPDLAVLGHLGVCLFFAISGFVMILSVDRDPAPSSVTFSLRRVCRVVPMYWTMTSVKLTAVLLGTSVTVTTVVSPEATVRSYLFIPTYNADGRIEPLWTVGWTLVFEMGFYALIALALAVRVDPVRLATPVLIVLAGLSVIRPDDGPAAWFFANPVVLYFAAGMAIARFVRHRSAWRLAAPIGGLAVVAGVIGSVRTGMVDPEPLLVLVGITAVLLLAVVTEDRAGARTPRLLVTLGAASYALYLTHPLIGPAVPAVLRLVALDGVPATVALAATVAVPVALSPLVTRFVEQPLSALSARVLLPRRTPRAPRPRPS